jgi:tRNA-Thr(GGU) m(6)t(6)A37 methyltransferase TsaA
MIQEARGILKLYPNSGYRSALNHLEQFSHLWLIFIFNQNSKKDWRPTIRPPRLDAPRRVGVFASRSPHRPNPIGLSAVKLEKIDLDAPGGIELHLSGVDILDRTPVLDIKPYLPFADSIPGASGGWAETEIPRYPVHFSSQSLEKVEKASLNRKFIEQVLEWDPRPTSQRRAIPMDDPQSEGLIFYFRILNFDVQWRIQDKSIYVVDLIAVE